MPCWTFPTRRGGCMPFAELVYRSCLVDHVSGSPSFRCHIALTLRIVDRLDPTPRQPGVCPPLAVRVSGQLHHVPGLAYPRAHDVSVGKHGAGVPIFANDNGVQDGRQRVAACRLGDVMVKSGCRGCSTFVCPALTGQCNHGWAYILQRCSTGCRRSASHG